MFEILVLVWVALLLGVDLLLKVHGSEVYQRWFLVGFFLSLACVVGVAEVGPALPLDRALNSYG